MKKLSFLTAALLTSSLAIAQTGTGNDVRNNDTSGTRGMSDDTQSWAASSYGNNNRTNSKSSDATRTNKTLDGRSGSGTGRGTASSQSNYDSTGNSPETQGQ